jgi:hypothetical protein
MVALKIVVIEALAFPGAVVLASSIAAWTCVAVKPLLELSNGVPRAT